MGAGREDPACQVRRAARPVDAMRALARTLPEMLVARVLLGLMGAVSTFAFGIALALFTWSRSFWLSAALLVPVIFVVGLLVEIHRRVEPDLLDIKHASVLVQDVSSSIRVEN